MAVALGIFNFKYRYNRHNVFPKTCPLRPSSHYAPGRNIPALNEPMTLGHLLKEQIESLFIGETGMLKDLSCKLKTTGILQYICTE